MYYSFIPFAALDLSKMKLGDRLNIHDGPWVRTWHKADEGIFVSMEQPPMGEFHKPASEEDTSPGLYCHPPEYMRSIRLTFHQGSRDISADVGGGDVLLVLGEENWCDWSYAPVGLVIGFTNRIELVVVS